MDRTALLILMAVACVGTGVWDLVKRKAHDVLVTVGIAWGALAAGAVLGLFAPGGFVAGVAVAGYVLFNGMERIGRRRAVTLLEAVTEEPDTAHVLLALHDRIDGRGAPVRGFGKLGQGIAMGMVSLLAVALVSLGLSYDTWQALLTGIGLAFLPGTVALRAVVDAEERRRIEAHIADATRELGPPDAQNPGDRRLLPLVLLLGIALLGCGESPNVTPPGLDPEALPALTPVERTVLGGAGAEGPTAFGSVTAVALLPGGGAVAVADGMPEEIRIFDLDGRFRATLGGRGGGPGEFRHIHEMRALDDGRLVVWDVQESRITSFGTDGRLLGAHRADLDPVRAILPTFVGFLADGRFVLRDQRSNMGMRDEPEGMRRDTVRLYLYGPEGAFSDTVAVLLDEEKWFYNRDRSWGSRTLIFGRELVTLAVGAEVWVGPTGGIAFHRYHPDGTLLGNLDLDAIPRNATPADIEAERERRVDGIAAPRGLRAFNNGPAGMEDAVAGWVENWKQSVRELGSYETLPAYDLAVPGPDGELWVREYPYPLDTMARWILIKPDGVPAGTLALPRASEGKAVGWGLVVVSETDEMDAAVVRVLEVRSGAEGEGR